MKKISLFLMLALLTAANIHAQKMVDTQWSTGEWFLFGDSDDGSKIVFSVGTGHEGGPNLVVKRVSNGVFENVSDNNEYPEIAKLKLVKYNCAKRGTTNALYCENAKGEVSHIFLESDDSFMENSFCDVLEGFYKGSDGKQYVFAEHTLSIDGVSAQYEPLACEMGYTNGFKYKGKRYCFMISENGVNLYTTNSSDDGGDYEPDKLWVKLTSDQEALGGRWVLLKDNIVTESYLGYYDKKLLRLMRNEIYARHGYKFASADLTNYFSKMSWYKPVSDNSKVKLSDIEQLNINLIKIAEDRGWHPDIEK